MSQNMEENTGYTLVAHASYVLFPPPPAPQAQYVHCTLCKASEKGCAGILKQSMGAKNRV
jgi:hypothetical protein